MAALGNRLLTLADVAKSKNKAIGKVAEVLMAYNSMNQDIPYQEMNEGTSHKEEIRSGLPAVYYRKANQAIPASKSTTEERTFTAAHFESKSQIDTAVAKRGGVDRIAYNRWNQAQGHIQAQAIEQANLMIYGSPVDSNRKVAGFADIYSTVNTANANTARNVIDAGGTGSNNTSIYLIFWGEQSVFGIYPAGTTAGLQRIDRSPGGKEIQIQALDTMGNPGSFWGFEEDFMTDHGLVVKDYRQGVRIANIDVTLLKSKANGVADLTDIMISANYLIDNTSNGQGVWYVNRTIQAYLHKQALAKVTGGGGATYENYQGRPTLMFLGMPVRLQDQILNSEARVV